MADRIATDNVLNRALHDPGEQEHDHPLNLEGPLYKATKKAQLEARAPLQVLADFILDIPAEMATERLIHGYEEVAGRLGSPMIMAGKFTIDCALKTMEEGQGLNDALRRETALTACIYLCVSALPEGFAQSVFRQLESGGPAPKGEPLFTKIIAAPGGAAVRAGIVANCRDGQDCALAKGVLTPATLAAALQHNPEFAERYKHDLAFKLGADCVVWANANGRLAEIQKQLPPRPEAAALEVRG